MIRWNRGIPLFRQAAACLAFLCAVLSAAPAAALDLDGSGAVDVGDAVRALQVTSGLAPAPFTFSDVDASGDVGLAEALAALQVASEKRPQPANPLTVTVGKDHTRAVEGVVTVDEGGTLTATTADGTAYTLVVAPYALLADEIVTLTPVTSVGGLPLSGGFLCGVMLAPSGLALMTPANLTISLPRDVNEADLIHVGIVGDGEEAFLCGATLADPRTLTMAVHHFSGAASGEGSDGDRQAVTNHTPSEPQDKYTQAGQQLLDNAKKQGRMPTDDELEPLFRAWYEESVRPKALAAKSDENQLACAIVEYMRWDREMNLLSWDLAERFATERENTVFILGEGLVNAFNHTDERCQQGDPNEAANMLSLAREATLFLGLMNVYEKYPQFGQVFNIDAVFEKVRACLVFEVGYDSILDFVVVDGDTTMRSHYVASSVVKPESEFPYPLRGYTPQTVTVQEIYVDPEATAGFGYPGHFCAKYLQLELYAKPLRCGGAQEPARHPAAGVLYYYPFPVEQTSWLIPPPLYNIYMELHMDSLVTEGPSANHFGAYYWVKDFMAGTGDNLLEKRVSLVRDMETLIVSEDTLFIIQHKPEAAP